MGFLFWTGRIVFWIIGGLFGFKLCGWVGSEDRITFFLLGILCGDTFTLIFTLMSTYVWLRLAVRNEITDNGDKTEWEETRKEVKGMWLGMNLNLMPEYLGGILGLCAGLVVHLLFRLEWLGTLSIAFLVGIVAEVILNITLPVLAAIIGNVVQRRI